jgi:F-type H+-transporting ATPase subunit delta
VPISEELQQEVVNKIKEVTAMKKIEVVTEVRESIIGGLIFEVGDLIVDASIGFDLNKIRQQFQSNEYVYQIR